MESHNRALSLRVLVVDVRAIRCYARIMQPLAKCFWSVLLVSVFAAVSCGDDSEERTPGTADAGPPPLKEIVQQEIANYDRRVRASCKCAVKTGTYPTEQACLEIGLSGPDWVDCETAALENYDSPQTRADNQCYQDFFKTSAECTEQSECDADKLNACGTFSAECLQLNNERLNLILAACPDFGLLSRVMDMPVLPNDAQSAANAAATCNGPLPVMKMLDKQMGGVKTPDWSCYASAANKPAAAPKGMQALQFKLAALMPSLIEGVTLDFFLGASTLEKPYFTSKFDGTSDVVALDVPAEQTALTVRVNGLEREETARSIAELREYSVPILKRDEPVQGFMLLTSQRKLIVNEALKNQTTQDDDPEKAFLVSYARDCSGHDVSGAQFELLDDSGTVVESKSTEGEPHQSYMQYAIPNPDCTYTSFDQSAWVLINAPVNATAKGKSDTYRLRVKGRMAETDAEPVVFGEAEVEMVAGAITFVHLPIHKF